MAIPAFTDKHGPLLADPGFGVEFAKIVAAYRTWKRQAPILTDDEFDDRMERLEGWSRGEEAL